LWEQAAATLAALVRAAGWPAGRGGDIFLLFTSAAALLPLDREIECLLYDSHQKGKMMILIVKTPGSQVDSPVAEGNRREGEGREMRDLHKDT